MSKIEMDNILQDAIIREDLTRCVNKTAPELEDDMVKMALKDKLSLPTKPLKKYPEVIRTWADPNAGSTFVLVSFWVGQEATLIKVRGTGTIEELTKLSEKLIKTTDSVHTYIIIEMGVWKLVRANPELYTKNRKNIIDDVRVEAQIIQKELEHKDLDDGKIQHDFAERARKLKCESLAETPTIDTFVIKQIALMENEKQINLAKKAVELLTKRKQLLSAYITIMNREQPNLADEWFPHYMSCIQAIGVKTPAITQDLIDTLLDIDENLIQLPFEEIKAELAKVEYDYGTLRT
jgi:hypothetical protein